MTDITVRKLDHTGREVWRYSGATLERGATWIKLQAYFNRDDRDDGYVVWRRGDRFVELFYADRWYNIFEVHDVSDDHLKGWYCNITYPATIEDHTVGNADLALDVWVNPAGDVLILDEDEFAELPLDAATRDNAWEAIAELRGRIERREPPFDQLKP
ncbi:MAG: DUF402 domain-containing protein [Anaerolineae bacterium]|nr:DUF402 domain-containing protein [Anaerolineae bacterium]